MLKILRHLTLLAIIPLIASCATTPPGVVASVDAERKLGEEKVPLFIASRGGLYRDAVLLRYVQGLTDKLVKSVTLPEGYAPLRIRILDTEAPSAYALPGGAIFVTRGLLGAVTSEAELAGVIAHEIGHVMRRHVAEGIAANERLVQDIISEQELRLRAAGTRSRRLSIVREELDKRMSDITTFSRAQELEADQIALEILTANGYPTKGFEQLLVRLEDWQLRRVTAMGIDSDTLAEVRRRSSYPKVTERIAALGPLTEAEPDAAAQALLMDRIDGMLFDNRYEGGVVRGGEYWNPRYDFGFDVPSNAMAQHGDGMQLLTANGLIGVRFDDIDDRSLEDLASAMGSSSGRSSLGSRMDGVISGNRVQSKRLSFSAKKQVTINGIPALTAIVKSKRGNDELVGRMTVFELDSDFVTMLGFSTDEDEADLKAVYDTIVQSARRAPVAGAMGFRRYETRRAGAVDSVSSVAAASSLDGDREATIRFLNGLGAAESIQSGEWIKTVK